MTSPQVENGYTRIANEIISVFVRTSIPGRHKDVWLFVVRKTYGYQKKRDYISLSQFQKGTGIDRTGVCRIIKDLVAWKLLDKDGSIYSINKNYSSWVVAQRPLGGSGVEDNRVVAQKPHTKETITKEIKRGSPIGENMFTTKGNHKPMSYQEETLDYTESQIPSKRKRSGYPGNLGSDVHKIGYQYAVAANERLRKMKSRPVEDALLLRQGAGKVLIERLKKYGRDEVVKRLRKYMDSDKFLEYPRLTAALSADTFMQIERGDLK